MEKNNRMVSLIEHGIDNVGIGDKVRWFYDDDNIDEIVYIGSSPIGVYLLPRIRIDRINKKGKIVQGGYVSMDELFIID